MNLEILNSGDLRMTADVNEQREIKGLLATSSSMAAAEETFIYDYLPDFESICPNEIGALTDAPIISDGESFFGFMNYQVESLLASLADGKSVTWQKG